MKRSHLLGALSALTALMGALILGSASAGQSPLPPGALLMVMIVAALLPILARHWRATLVLLLSWFVVEDLVRKLAGNDLRVYLTKDLIFIVLIVGFISTEGFLEHWRMASGSARWSLGALLIWALVMSVPTGLVDWRVPLLGMRLDFLYLPLVPIGYLLGGRANQVRRLLWLVLGLGVGASVLGIVQAIVGPSFLAPGVATPGLRLELYRGTQTAFFRPTATFVDAGRFLSFVELALAVALGLLATTRRRALIGFATSILAVACYLSGGRTGILVGIALLLVGVVAAPFAYRRPTLGRTIQLAGFGMAALLIVSSLLPVAFEARLSFYDDTLAPTSSKNEWAAQWRYRTTGLIRGIRLGGLIGQGSGRESLGRQYLSGLEGPALASRSTDPGPLAPGQVESGYGSIAVEWGLVGLILWLTWQVSWARRLWQHVRAAPPQLAGFALVVFAWIVFFLFFGSFAGLASFQNYATNAYFWLFSGVLLALPTARIQSATPIGSSIAA